MEFAFFPWLLAAAGAVSALGAAENYLVRLIQALKSPNAAQDRRLQSLEKHLEAVDTFLAKDKARLDGIDESTAHHAIGEVSHIELARLDLRMRALFIEMTSQFLRLFVEARRILEDLGCHAMHHIILQSAVVIKVEELPYIECVKEEVRHGVTQFLAERHVRLSEMHALFGSLVADNM